MIVDVHTHIWDAPEQLGRGASQRVFRHVDQPWDRPDASTTAHDAAMAPVQHAIILGFESKLLGASIAAEQVARWVARRPDKYIGFAGIDPLGDDYLRKLDSVKPLGLQGVTVSPAGQGFHPTHTRAMRLFEKCEALKLPVFVHQAMHLSADTCLEYAQPYLLDQIARTFPDLRLVIGQVGYPWVEQTLVLIGKHRNVYADLSDVVTRPWQLYNLLLSAHQQGVMDHMMFGSDFPFCTPQKAITTIYSVNTLTQGTPLPSVPREQLRSIVERDVLVCLGISRAAPPTRPAEPARYEPAVVTIAPPTTAQPSVAEATPPAEAPSADEPPQAVEALQADEAPQAVETSSTAESLPDAASSGDLHVETEPADNEPQTAGEPITAEADAAIAQQADDVADEQADVIAAERADAFVTDDGAAEDEPVEAAAEAVEVADDAAAEPAASSEPAPAAQADAEPAVGDESKELDPPHLSTPPAAAIATGSATKLTPSADSDLGDSDTNEADAAEADTHVADASNEAPDADAPNAGAADEQPPPGRVSA